MIAITHVMKIFPYISLFLILTCPEVLSAQQFFRIRVDVSIKTKVANGEMGLTVGKIFYDRNERKIVYDLSFPEKSLLVTSDTITCRIVNKQIVQKSFNPSMTEFSIFHLALSSHLPDFGLKQTQYEVLEVSREGEMVITTWTPPKKLEEDLGNIIVSIIDKKLFGVVFYSPEGNLISKQFYEDYFEQNGIAFPGKITEISYSDEGESYQIMTFKNLVLDELENNHMYSFSIDGFL